MSVFLGFNAGGTKTDCTVIDSAGKVLAESAGGPANPLRIGFAKACAALGDSAKHALAEGRKDARDVRAICAGIAGAGRPRVARRIAAYLMRAFPQSVVRVTTDIEISLEAAVGDGQGIVVVAGTGSAVCGRNADGKFVRAGGWGPWIGDKGSAYDIGRSAVEASLRARDHLGPATILGEKILLAAEVRDWDSLIERIAKRPDNVFPKLFPIVLESAEAGDSVAQEILAAARESLAEMTRSVVNALGLDGQSFTLAKSGGMIGRSAQFDSELDRELAAAAPGARIAPLQVPPARAAAELARKMAGNAAAHGA